ncbi:MULTISPECIES: molybdenum ABC transporter permease [unclassified Xanthobacter]|uniref:molybdate ABC transporter permease subunit n=1 Tax=unclassified Xanthobacter TaxID=2623496 RepID=UPI001F485025|nr:MULTISPECIES: ABC transporter permease subunit [unclassified Xanthobacter]
MSLTSGRSGSRLLGVAAVVAALVLAVLVAPFVTLATATDWSSFQLADGDWDAIWVSLGYGGLAMVIIILLGTPLAWWLARSRARGKWIADVLLLLPLLSPPLALGILLASFYGPYGPAGALLSHAGLVLSNNPPAFILATCYGAGPYFVIAARSAFEGVPLELEEVGLTLGRGPVELVALVTLPLAAPGLLMALAVAWVRAVGEFGIVLVVAYFPQGMPVKLWVNLQDLGLQAVYPLLWAFFLLAMPVPLLMRAFTRRWDGPA